MATQLFELLMPFKASNKEIISEPYYRYQIAIIQYDKKQRSTFKSYLYFSKAWGFYFTFLTLYVSYCMVSVNFDLLWNIT